jgi:hypothetical protein
MNYILRHTGWIFLLLLVLTGCRSDPESGSGLNLIPDTRNPSPDYWCTWGAQNFAADTRSLLHTLSLGGHSLTAEYLNEDMLFGQHGWSASLPPELREDLFMILDVGWDVPPGVQFDQERWRLGSLNVAEDKFPSCKGSRKDKLSALNKRILGDGWKGTGLWLPSHPYLDFKDGKAMEQARMDDYYHDALDLCREAGIRYWKIDYGYRGGADQRQYITRLGTELFPELIIEHGRGSGPLNDDECPWDTENYNGSGSFRKWDDGRILGTFVDLAGFSQVLRTYDVTQQLSIPTTLDRVAQVLRELSGTGEPVIINCEDEPYIGAVLGCAIGIMRHPMMIEPEVHGYDPFHLKNRIDELIRAVKWHRIAPAIPAGKTQNLLDSIRLLDQWEFRRGDGWATWVTGKEVGQGAPARISRGMPLAEVHCLEDPPYVLCSRHPNGALAVGTLPRVSSPREIHYPRADVIIEIPEIKYPIGIFGRYASLTLEVPEDLQLKKIKIYAQDLAGREAHEITQKITINNHSITIPGEVIEEVGLSAASKEDLSDPGFVIRIHK